ncbi:MAG: carbon-nitrogen hydrolase family protein [Bryobacteraceae bacterium]|nr:carbon-nitrogen hydrolase family protein [Bryobacteraceae bacterium]
MKSALLLIVISALAAGAEPLFEQSSFASAPGGLPVGWQVWAAREESAPRVYVDEVNFRGEPGALVVSGASNTAASGGWERVVNGIRPGQWYRFVAYYRTEHVAYEPRQVVPRLDWITAEGKRAGKPDYVFATQVVGDWKRVSMDAPAPKGASGVRLQLLMWDCPTGTVWWDDISLTPISPPLPRPVTVASIKYRPRTDASPENNVARFIEVIDRTVTGKVDVIVLPEGITVVDTGKKYAEVAEPIPGPTTERLGEAARRHDAYIVAGIYEREGPAIYNTAVLIDRSGKYAGKYRKVYIPREETEAGITAGSDYPVFQTDFGKIGIMICWDVQYADPARGLALRGAEMILMPIWGGSVPLGRARAIENQVFLAASGYDYPTHILDPDGEVLAIAREQGTAAVATVDLNHRYTDDWLGYMRGRFMKELRLDVPVEPAMLVR